MTTPKSALGAQDNIDKHTIDIAGRLTVYAALWFGWRSCRTERSLPDRVGSWRERHPVVSVALCVTLGLAFLAVMHTMIAGRTPSGGK